MKVTNADRANWAEVGLVAFSRTVYADGYAAEPIEEIVSDFMCDLFHFCDKRELDWDKLNDRAAATYLEEKKEEDAELDAKRLEAKCSDPKCLGWGIFETDRGYLLQRCDECKQFQTDEDAMAHAHQWIAERKASG